MTNTSSARGDLKQWVMSWFEAYLPSVADAAFEGLVVLWLALFAIALHFVLHKIVHRLLSRLTEDQAQPWHQALLGEKLFQRVALTLQGAVVQIQAGLWLDDPSSLLSLIDVMSNQWILLFGLLAFFSLLDALQTVMSNRPGSLNFPIRGLIQTVKLVASVLVGLLSLSLIMGKSPLILLSGLGALSAVLLLVFRDPILGLVAGIQLSANDMLSVGDWLEMPKYGADGDVTDIALTTVKVRNWDKTITTIPTYALISDSFKNWRGMADAGGRRIKRGILIETTSIRFLDDKLFQRLQKAHLLGDYLEEKQKGIEATDSGDDSTKLNHRQLTNVGTFRAYLLRYLQSHPHIHQNMTLLVRQLEPTGEGLPIQIYAFTNTTAWNAYEDIQSDIFDHIFAVLPEFDLRAYQAPTGHDVSLLGKTMEPPATQPASA